jgi:hypothetical protein
LLAADDVVFGVEYALHQRQPSPSMRCNCHTLTL